MPQLYQFICLASLAMLFIACEDCGPNDEPQLYLSLTSSKSFQIDTVYAPSSIKPLEKGIQKYTGTSSTLALPLSLHADSTQYKLRLNGRIETITVFYRRNFSYKSRKCGYVINLYEPANGRQYTSSIGRVNSVFYGQNSYKTSFLTSSSPTSIALFLNL